MPMAPKEPEKKKMPKPSVAMKGINWTKLAGRQVLQAANVGCNVL